MSSSPDPTAAQRVSRFACLIHGTQGSPPPFQVPRYGPQPSRALHKSGHHRVRSSRDTEVAQLPTHAGSESGHREVIFLGRWLFLCSWSPTGRSGLQPRRHCRSCNSCFARRVTPLFFPTYHLGWLDHGMGPTQPLWGAAGGAGGGAGGGGGPGGVCGLLGLGGVKGRAFLSFFFDSLTLGPVTELLRLDDRGLFRRFSFSFSFSRRLLRLFSSSFALGVGLLDSLVASVAALLTSADWASSTFVSGAGSLQDGPAFDLLASFNLGAPSELSLGSLLDGLGAWDWEFSTKATLPFVLAGVSRGGTLGGGNTRLTGAFPPIHFEPRCYGGNETCTEFTHGGHFTIYMQIYTWRGPSVHTQNNISKRCL